MNERYCPSKKPRWEHDKECYYHGEDATCPYCGTKTLEVKEGTYKSIGGYTAKEIHEGMIEQNITNFGTATPFLDSLDYETHGDGSIVRTNIGNYSKTQTTFDKAKVGES